MNNNQIGAIHLSGEDAFNFAKSFFYPSEEEIAIHNAKIESINSNISISSDIDGFKADVKDLDLTFLEDKIEKEQHIVMVKLDIKIKNKSFNNVSCNVSQVVVDSVISKEFNLCEVSSILNIAA